MAERARDGSYYAKDGMVWKRPVETKMEGGSRISIGFPVCKMSDIIGDEGAETVAELMNQGDVIPALLSALEQCAAPFSTSPGSVEQCQAEIGAEFQRRMDIAGNALTAVVGGTPK